MNHSQPIAIGGELTCPTITKAVAFKMRAFREWERARFSRDEGRAADTLTTELKGLRDAWSESKGASQ